MINRIDTQAVKIIRLVSGEEICCKFPLHKDQLPENSKLLRLQEPMLIKYVPRITEHGISDYIALVKWVGFTDEKIITIPIDKIITIANATPQFTKRYAKLVISLRQAKQALPNVIERDLKDDDWDDFDEENSDLNERDIDKNDIKELSDLLNMPSKKVH
jgi:hypothetical protein